MTNILKDSETKKQTDKNRKKQKTERQNEKKEKKKRNTHRRTNRQKDRHMFISQSENFSLLIYSHKNIMGCDHDFLIEIN